MIFITRKADFAAAHFYWNPLWSEERNREVFGKCSNRHGHGHNYTLEVTVRGEVDPTSGFVVDLKHLKEIMEREVVSTFDHRHLNHEVPEFAALQPTAENIALVIWTRLESTSHLTCLPTCTGTRHECDRRPPRRVSPRPP